MIAPGRNSPCPCGSGKRYKDCHGALGAPVDPLAGDGISRRQLDAALAAQQAGRYAEAIALYEAVIAAQPRNFDALHMLGVVHYQRGDFDRAHALVGDALATRPADAGARHNMDLIEAALERRVIERAICAETLPRFAKRCVAAPTLEDRWRWRGTTLDLIVSRPDLRDPAAEAESLTRWLGATATVWVYRQPPAPAAAGQSLRTIDPATDALPRGRVAIFYGADISPAAWYARAAVTDV
ncbi:MAG TPA: tetratricopeptide repeat protein, partial [Casimicrobiaceae bacterium]|nr:tetratricopeptide repeat protein [Casimicrobiaceae bacterium]